MKYKKFNSSNRKYKLFISLLVVSLLLGFVLYESYAKYRREKTVDIIGGVVSLSKVCEYELGQSWNFAYTGGEQEFTVPCDGTYKLETWGAQGGISQIQNAGYYTGGYGAYSSGNIEINSSEKLYINVGSKGGSNYINTLSDYGTDGSIGYNGGGTGFVYAYDGAVNSAMGGGGGATHIATKSGLLSSLENDVESILIVSGAGAGAVTHVLHPDFSGAGGNGGGIIGGASQPATSTCYTYGLGGTQTGGGGEVRCVNSWETGDFDIHYGLFGKGNNILEFRIMDNAYTGAGAGFYGGGSAIHGPAGGGSSYIGNSLLTNKAMYCYNCTESDDVSTRTISNTCVNSYPTANCSKMGNGYARITLVQYDLEPPTLSVNNNVVSIDEQGFAINGIKRYDYYITSGSDIPDKNTIPTGTITNNITLDINNDSTIYVRTVDNNNRKGSWSVGYSVLYYNCDFQPGYSWNYDYTGNEQEFDVPCSGTYKIELWGAQGDGNGAYTKGLLNLYENNKLYTYIGGHSTGMNGGYNGGGNGISSGKAGGGATDIRLVSGTWNDIESLKSRIMVAAGGGGDSHGGYGAPGGSINGIDGIPIDDLINYSGALAIGTGSTQISGGRAGYFSWNGYAPTDGGFGYGGNGCTSYGGGGGSGYYGGGGSGVSSLSRGGGGSGSSFISGHNGCDAISESSTSSNIIHTGQPNHYSGYVFSNTVMIDGAGYNWTNTKGNYVGQTQPDGSVTAGHSGNGYARITLVSVSN